MNHPSPRPRSRRAMHPVWALIVLAVCAPLIFSALKRLKMVNDVETWLPSNDAGAQILSWTQAHFEPENRFLISWDSSSLGDPRVEKLAETLRPAGVQLGEGTFPEVLSVITPHQVLTNMLEHGLDSETAVQRLTGVLVGSGSMKVQLTDAGREHRSEVEEVLRVFARTWGRDLEFVAPVQPTAAEPPPLPANTEPAEPTAAEESKVFLPLDWKAPPHDFQVRASGLHPQSDFTAQLQQSVEGLKSGDAPLVQRCFFSPGAPVAISVSLTELGDDEIRDRVDAIRQAAIGIGIPESELRLGGSPIGRIELNRASGKALWNPDVPWWKFHKRSPLILSALVGTVLAFVLLKSVRLALLVLFTAAYTAVATVALIPVTGQSLNTVLMVMPDLMLVITMSSLIHLANYWRHAACAGEPDPVGNAVQMSLEPTLLASVTTAIGMASLVTSVLLPVRQFGLFSAAGCVIAICMVLWVFPALLRTFPGRPAPLAPPDENRWHWYGLWVVRHARKISIVCLGLYAAAFFGLRHFHTETKVIRYFPEHARIVQDYQFLEDNLAGIVGVDVILRFPPEKSKRRDDDEEPADASDQPVVAARPEGVSLDLFQRMGLVSRLQHKLKSLDGVSGTMSLADFRQEIETRPERVDARYLRSLQIAKKKIFDTHREDTREFVTHAVTPLSVVIDEVPQRIEVGEEVWRIRAQCSVLTDRQYQGFIEEIDATISAELRDYPGVDHLVTGMVPLFLRTQEALLQSLINSFGVAFLTIAAVMMYQMRSVLAGALVMLPNILPIVFVFGAVSWSGIPLDVGTMVTASIAMGISVDSELHFVTWYRQSLRQGLSRDEAVAHGLIHCGPAMWQSCLVISLALTMMMFTDLLMISRFGWIMAAMIIVAMLADLLYMPALMAGLMGRVIHNKLRRELPLPVAPAATVAPREAVTAP